ncbi:hypothetical protein L9F63_009439, partial [Diploptera punctata]
TSDREYPSPYLYPHVVKIQQSRLKEKCSFDNGTNFKMMLESEIDRNSVYRPRLE